MGSNIVGEMGGNWFSRAIAVECDRQDEDAIARAALNSLADRLRDIIPAAIAEFNRHPKATGRPSAQINVLRMLTDALEERDGVVQI